MSRRKKEMKENINEMIIFATLYCVYSTNVPRLTYILIVTAGTSYFGFNFKNVMKE